MALIKPERRCGNTTRQIDEWVQELFVNGEVYIRDHAYEEERGVASNFANRQALDTLFRRLYNEHGLDKNALEFDRLYSTLRLIKNKATH